MRGGGRRKRARQSAVRQIPWTIGIFRYHLIRWCLVCAQLDADDIGCRANAGGRDGGGWDLVDRAQVEGQRTTGTNDTAWADGWIHALIKVTS